MQLDLTSETLSAFLSDFFIHFNKHLEAADDGDSKLRIAREAAQYLHGAHALLATELTGRRVAAARDRHIDGIGGLLNNMFEDATSYLEEVEEEVERSLMQIKLKLPPPLPLAK